MNEKKEKTIAKKEKKTRIGVKNKKPKKKTTETNKWNKK